MATLSHELSLAQATTSQHLALLRTRKVLESRKEGHRVYYSLVQPRLSKWLVDGLNFLEEEATSSKGLEKALKQVKTLWSAKKGGQRAKAAPRT